MQKFIRLVILLAIGVAGFLIWRTLFPNPEKVIRSHLNKLARAASFSSKDGTFTKLSYAQNLADFFTGDAEVAVSVPGREELNLKGRDDLVQAAAGARATLGDLKVDFSNVKVELSADKQSAIANLTAKAITARDDDFGRQELKFTLQKADGKWLIRRVETVKTLTKRNVRRLEHA